MKSFAWTALMLVLHGLACAPIDANKRRYRLEQDRLDPDPAKNPGAPASTPGSGTTGSANTSTGGIKPVPAYTQGNKSNIFEGATFYIDSSYVKNLNLSASLLPQYAARIETMKSWGGTGVWLDSIQAINSRLKPVLAEARTQAQNSGKSVVVPIVVYDLPNRDCYALASNGELLLKEDGMNKYKTLYIDVIAKLLQDYSDIRVAAVIEPDSLPNAITNRGKVPIAGSEGCTDTVLNGYKEGTAYAIQKLSLPNTALYLDAGHSGWLGYERPKREEMIAMFKEVALAGGGLNRIRGLALNVSNYTPLDNHQPLPQANGTAASDYFVPNMIQNEHAYAADMVQIMTAAGFLDPRVIIDTGRNGEPQSRSKWGNWCNIARARIGERPRVQPRPEIDAYIWIKPPGESDGSSEPAPADASEADRKKRPDPTCRYDAGGNIDTLDGAPLAGQWFLKHFENLVRQPGDKVNLGRATH